MSIHIKIKNVNTLMKMLDFVYVVYMIQNIKNVYQLTIEIFHDVSRGQNRYVTLPLMIRRNKRSCTHWKSIITSYNSYVYNTLCLRRSLIRSIQSGQINTIACKLK